MDLETKLLEHIGNRLKELNRAKSYKSKLQEAKEMSARQELKEILEVIQKFHNASE